MPIKRFLKRIRDKLTIILRSEEEKKLELQVLELQEKVDQLLENQCAQAGQVNSLIADIQGCQRNHMAILTEELQHIRQDQSVLYPQTERLNFLAENIQSYQKNHLRFFIEDMHNFQQELRDYLSWEYQRYRNDSTKKKVLLCGFYGAQNCGDELILRACLDMIDTSKVDVTIMLYNNYAFNPNYYRPYNVIHYPKSIGDTDFLAETFDAIIWGGGAVIDDTNYFYNSIRTNLSYILNKTTHKMLSMGKKAIILGVSSSQKIQNKKYIEELNYIFRNADIVSLRDTNSRNSLTAAGIDCSRVQIVDDLALSLTYPQQSKLPAADIGLVLMPNQGNLEQMTQITKQVVNECNTALDKSCKIRFISFYNEYDNDVKLYQTIAQQAGLENYEIIDTVFTPEEVASVIHSCDFIASMRYHAMLLSAILGKKTLGISLGGIHPHYACKVNYIQEHYCKELCVVSCEHLEPEKIRQALYSEITPYEQEKLHLIYENTRKLFEEAMAHILEE